MHDYGLEGTKPEIGELRHAGEFITRIASPESSNRGGAGSSACKDFDGILMPRRAKLMLAPQAHPVRLPNVVRNREEQVMNGLASTRGVGFTALGAVLLAATLMLAAGPSQASPHGGRGSGGGWHGGGGYGGGGGRSYGGGHAYRSGGDGRAYADRGARFYGGGGRNYGGGGGRYYGGGRAFYGGGRFYGHYGYRYVHPRSYTRFSIGIGVPYYYPPAYRYYVEPYPVEVESSTSIDVTNEPPANCYYYDRFCDLQFSNLDDYTDHVENQDHPRTIEIVDKDSGDTIRTLEFVGGYWSVKK
jgi:hypothetical protein